MRTAFRTLCLMSLACTPMAASAQMRALPRAKLAFPAGKSVVQIPFERHQEFIVITVSVKDSKPLRFILDSGAPLMVLPDAALAETLDLQIMMQAQVGGIGDGPMQTAPLAGSVSARVGELHISDAMMIIGIAAEAIPGLDGILGSSIFENAVVEIDWEAQVLTIREPQSFQFDDTTMALPLKRADSGHPYVPAEINIDGNKWVTAELAVDTGARSALGLSVGNHDQLHLPQRVIETTVGWGSRGAARGAFGRVYGLRLGTHEMRDLVAGFHAGPRAGKNEQAGVIGLEVLQRFHITFDRPHERLILRPNGRLGDPFPFGTTGLRFRPWPAGTTSLTVADVIDESPAQHAGIAVGDEIIAINDHPVGSLRPAEIRDLERSAPGTELQLIINRTGARHRKQLVTKALLQ